MKPNGIPSGMTLRDWFAGQAMPTAMQREATDAEGYSLPLAEWPAWRAAYAYRMADAMLAERAKGGAR
jgi:hypothetical protein